MAIDKGHLEGIRLQAERVVRSYNDLRGTAKNSDFASDDFPVGKVAELFQQVRALAGWIEPAPAASDDEQAEPSDERQAITVLVGNHVQAVYGLHGVTQALVDLDEPASLELAMAARELVGRLYGGLGSLTQDVEEKIEAVTDMKVRQ